jgi:hypothetical protein
MTSASEEKWRPFNCFFQSGRTKDLSAPLYRFRLDTARVLALFVKNVLRKRMIAWVSPGNGRPGILYRKMRLCSAKQFADVRRGQKVKPHSTTTEHVESDYSPLTRCYRKRFMKFETVYFVQLVTKFKY